MSKMKSGKTGKVDPKLMKVVRKVAYFICGYSAFVGFTSLLRVVSSINPDVQKEGKVSLAEYSPAFVGPLVFWVFGFDKLKTLRKDIKKQKDKNKKRRASAVSTLN